VTGVQQAPDLLFVALQPCGELYLGELHLTQGHIQGRFGRRLGRHGYGILPSPDRRGRGNAITASDASRYRFFKAIRCLV
jgi:hypothetical protein